MSSFDSAPLVAGTATGTMSVADIYPTHSGIGGITTQDRALPAFAEATAAHQARSQTFSDPESIVGTPAAYLAALLVVVAVGAWLYR